MEDRGVTESLVLSCIYQDLTLIADINLKETDFDNSRTSFYYTLASELVKNIKSLNELAVKSYVSSSGLSDLYEEYGGYESIRALQRLGNKDDFMTYVDDLKKHILVENLKERRNFDINKEITFHGSKLVPAKYLPKSTAYEFHNFVQLIFNDLEVELERKDLVYETLSFTENELKDKLEGKVTDASRFDIFLDWEEDGEYRYMRNFGLLDETLGGIQVGNGLHAVGASSGVGKTTFCLNLAISLVTTSNENILIISNEQQSLYYKNLLMSIICQVVFKQYSLTRKKITRNQFTEEEKKVLIEANKFIAEKFDNKIRFLSVPTFNSESICAIIKREKLKNNVGVIVLDTFKFEGGNNNGSSSSIAIELVETSRAIDHIATEYKVGVILPVQLLVSQDKVSYLTSSALSNSKQLKEVCNSVLLMRRVRPFELDKENTKYFLKPYRWEKGSKGYIKKEMTIIDSSKNLTDKGKRFDKNVIDKSQQHILLRIDKSRNGESDIMILFEIDGASGVLREKSYVGYCYNGMLGD